MEHLVVGAVHPIRPLAPLLGVGGPQRSQQITAVHAPGLRVRCRRARRRQPVEDVLQRVRVGGPPADRMRRVRPLLPVLDARREAGCPERPKQREHGGQRHLLQRCVTSRICTASAPTSAIRSITSSMTSSCAASAWLLVNVGERNDGGVGAVDRGVPPPDASGAGGKLGRCGVDDADLQFWARRSSR